LLFIYLSTEFMQPIQKRLLVVRFDGFNPHPRARASIAPGGVEFVLAFAVGGVFDGDGNVALSILFAG